jgi:S-adenosylmethionine hydrolase
MHVDHFGNLATNLRREQVDPAQTYVIHILGRQISGIRKAFGEGASGELVALFDSSDLLSIAVVNGSAAQMLQAKVSDPVKLVISPT